MELFPPLVDVALDTLLPCCKLLLLLMDVMPPVEPTVSVLLDSYATVDWFPSGHCIIVIQRLSTFLPYTLVHRFKLIILVNDLEIQ